MDNLSVLKLKGIETMIPQAGLSECQALRSFLDSQIWLTSNEKKTSHTLTDSEDYQHFGWWLPTAQYGAASKAFGFLNPR